MMVRLYRKNLIFNKSESDNRYVFTNNVFIPVQRKLQK